MAEGKILGTDFVDQSAHEEFKKLLAESEAMVKSFVDLAGGANAFREALSKSEGIKGTTDAIKNRRKELTEMEKLQKQVIDTNQRIVNMETQMGKAVEYKNVQLQETRKHIREEIQASKLKEGSYAQLDLQLKQMVRSYKLLSDAERNAAKGTELLDKIQKVRTSLGEMDASMGNWQRNVGNYRNQTYQLTQVLREMPAFAVSAQTGILGLSNNLPMLADAFSQTAKQAGGTGAALKIFGASLLSFGSLFSIAIGLFTIFSKEIIGFISGTDDAAESVDKYKDSITDATAQMGQLRLNLELTQKGIISKEQFLAQYNETLGKVAGTTDDFNVAEQKTIDNSGAYIEMMVMKAKSAKLLEIAVRKATEATEMTDDWWTVLKAQTKAGAQAFGQTGNPLLFFTQDPQDSYNAYKRAFDAERQKAEDAWKKSQEELAKYMQKNGFKEYNEPKPDKQKKQKEAFVMVPPDLTPTPEEIQNIEKYYERVKDEAIKLVGKYKEDPAVQKALEDGLLLPITGELSPEKAAELNNLLLRRKQLVVKNSKEIAEENRKIIDAISAYMNSTLQAMTTINDIIAERERAKFDEREKAMTAYYDDEERRIMQSFMAGAAREKELAKLAAQREAQQKIIDRDRAIAAKKAAQRQRIIDINAAIANTALAVTGALARYKTDGYAAIAQAIAVGIAGTAEVARIIATPLPQYAEGTDNHPGGLAIVGERGQELVKEPGKAPYLTPDKTTIMNLPAKTQVIPHEDLMQRLYASAYVKMAGAGKVTTDTLAVSLLESFDELSSKVDRMTRVLEDKKMSSSVIIDIDSSLYREKNRF